MIGRQFYVPRMPVGVVAIGNAGEALLIRALLESLGADVSLYLPGTPADFLMVLQQGVAAPDYLVISGHGDQTGFIFGEFAPEIDDTILQDGRLPAEALAFHVDLPGKVVLSTACETGSDAFGAAFLAGGVDAYIAPAGAPEGADVPLFMHHLLYRLLQQKTSLAAAFDAARRACPGGALFTSWPALTQRLNSTAFPSCQ